MKKLIIPIAALIVVVLDQIAKALIVSNLSLNQTAEVIGGVLRFRLTHNTGAAFGVLQGATGALSIVAVAIVAAIFYSASRMGSSNNWGTLALGLIVGGALGNLIDRLRLGFVVDFVEVYGPHIQLNNTNYTFPVFNVADSAITVGVILLLITLLRADQKQTTTTATATTNAASTMTTTQPEIYE